MMNKLRTWVEIDTRALRHNSRVLHDLVRSTHFARSGQNPKILAVVKSNAYGHGLVEVARVLSGRTATSGTTAGKIDWFGVDDIDEALALRKAGVKLPILVLGYTLPSRFAEAVKHDVSVTFASLESLRQIKLKVKSEKLKVHIKLETGLNRQGVTEIELNDVTTLLGMLECVQVEGIYSHFAGDAPKFGKFSRGQLVKFSKMAEQIERGLGYDVIKHIADTAATVLLPKSRLDMVRIGIGSYGLDPFSDPKLPIVKKLNLKPVLSWKVIVSQVKYVAKGEGIGYDLTERAKKNMKIAIVPVGYWQGYPRSASGRGFVIVHNQRCKIVGRISMDMMTIDVTNIPKVKMGDKVVLIGKADLSAKTQVTAEEVATKAGTINYELVTRINSLIPRIYK